MNINNRHSPILEIATYDVGKSYDKNLDIHLKFTQKPKIISP
jgi:hypothetical protein